MRNWLKTASLLAKDRSANVAIITAFSMLPLIGITGLSIDYAIALSTKAKLDAAADAAVISAITKAQSEITASSGTTGTALTDGQTQGAAAFRANAGALSFGAVPVPSVVLTRTGQSITGTLSYQAAATSNFGKLFGVTQMQISGSSVSNLAMPSYINIYVVLDVSSSMGIGATNSDQQITYNATGGCAVACHYTGTTSLARTAGATLRIDVAKQAIVSALNQVRLLLGSAVMAVFPAADH